MESQIARPSHPSYGRLLRQWRLTRRRSQESLALDAEISARHMSFLENGRAKPSREMVVRLSHALDIPLRERNALMLAAGYAPVYEDRRLSDPELEPVRRAFNFMLQQQEPYPALVVDGAWNIVMVNDAARRIFGLFLTPPASKPERPPNTLHSTFDPQGIRQYIENWEELAWDIIQRLHREVAAGTDARSADLLRELLAYPGVPPQWGKLELTAPAAPFMKMRLRKGDLSLAFFTTLSTLGSPQDALLQQLRVESFFPVDRTTEEIARRLAGTSKPPSQ